MWALSSGGWTPHLNSIRTWKATQVLSWLLVKGPCTLHPCDQSWMAEAWQRQNLLAWVMLCPRCYGHKISWSHKGTQSRIQLFTKTTKVLSFSRKMDGPPVANKPNTSTFAISLSLTTSKVERCLSIKMLADFFTKPLQGTPFHIFWDNIMGIDCWGSIKEP